MRFAALSVALLAGMSAAAPLASTDMAVSESLSKRAAVDALLGGLDGAAHAIVQRTKPAAEEPHAVTFANIVEFASDVTDSFDQFLGVLVIIINLIGQLNTNGLCGQIFGRNSEICLRNSVCGVFFGPDSTFCTGE